MDHPTGTIVATGGTQDPARVVVEVAARTACARCAAGRGCGAGLFSGSARRQVEARVRAGLRPAQGDTVVLEVADRTLLQAAAVVYGIPLVAALIGGGLALALSLGDAAAAAASLAGLTAGLAASRYYLRRPGCLGRYVPTVTAVVRAEKDSVA